MEFQQTNGGKCFAILPDESLKTPSGLWNRIEFNFTENIAKYDLPNIKVAFTSNENAPGSYDAQWFEGESFNIEIDPRDKMTYKVSLKLEKLEQLEETSYCSTDNDYYRCLAKR